MKYISFKEKHVINNFTIGGKAKNLFRLLDINMPVPAFIVIPQEEFQSLFSNEILNADNEKIINAINQINIPCDFIQNITNEFPGTKYFAVRSSAADEDGDNFSFAGQFESFLFVTKDSLAEKIKQVWVSAFSKRVSIYRNEHKIHSKFGLAVIVQKMIDADVSGVAFGINPVTGNPNERYISSVFGLGEGLVSGELNADNFIVNDKKISKQIVEKAHAIIAGENGSIQKIIIEKQKQKLASLNDEQVYELTNVLDKLFIEYKKPQDIEFAFKDEKLFILQARAITTTHKFLRQNENYIVWDNSNIIESYPGVTTPLTFSFISKSYEKAYKLFSGYMGVNAKTIKQNERVFANTLGMINGRVYYNLRTWYHMLAMLPAYNINARFMEKMMGVKEQFDVPETYRLSKQKAWLSIIKMAVNMFARFISLPKKRKAFTKLLNETISKYKSINFTEKSAYELMKLYINFENLLLNEWKAPLLNDFFAMIFYGTLQKQCEQHISKKSNLHNDLLCGSNDIISTQPIYRTIKIATIISLDEELKKLFTKKNENEIWQILSNHSTQKFLLLKKEIDAYIFDFGERCVGELKLETVSYTQDPTKFIKLLKSYVETNINSKSISKETEIDIRNKAEQELEKKLRFSFSHKWKIKFILNNTRELVSARENLRYERTRAFGIVRELFSNIGKQFYNESIIDNKRDIFFLTKDEIFSFIEGTSVTQNLKSLIAIRKASFENYQLQKAMAERFSTYGIVYNGNDFYDKQTINQTGKILQGIGCCPGKIKGKVRVVLNPQEVDSLHGDILVTTSTDPGWITIFPSASAIIVERGSVLSHSAIVSREMGKPCIVGVSGLLNALKTGDEIEMNGSTGEIKILQQHE